MIRSGCLSGLKHPAPNFPIPGVWMIPPFSCLHGPGIALGHFSCPYQVPRGHTAMCPLSLGLNLNQEALPPCPPFAYYGFFPVLLK